MIFTWLWSQVPRIGHTCDLVLKKVQIIYLYMHWGTKDSIWGAGLKKTNISAHFQWNSWRTCYLFNNIDGVPLTGISDGSRTDICYSIGTRYVHWLFLCMFPTILSITHLGKMTIIKMTSETQKMKKTLMSHLKLPASHKVTYPTYHTDCCFVSFC